MLTIRLPSDLTGNEEADKVWGLQTRPCAWHLNSARLGYLASGLQEVGPELGLNSSPSLLSLSTKRIYNNHHDGTILIPLQLIFLLICDMTRNSHWFVLQFRSSMAKVWKWTHLSLLCKTVLTGKIAFVCQNENLATFVWWNFDNFLVLLPIFSNMLIAKHAQPPSSMHSSGLDLIGYY